ncbi:hypothetical protein BpHYR1_046474 [Brachionus plicatilis]|uniref:Uncharacterized protein n=1 Tax=Brachionus plicatilis TaxID=10195 RepID=A0A3M7PNH6_BRAPC|nr:hypothetical protein BpHYR1_046474 [Brachionus plicatilis]
MFQDFNNSNFENIIIIRHDKFLAGISILVVLIFVNIISTFLSLYYHPGSELGILGENSEYFYKWVYIKPWTRSAPFLVGILVGYILFHHRKPGYNAKIKTDPAPSLTWRTNELRMYEIDIEHRKGHENGNADVLSRCMLEEENDVKQESTTGPWNQIESYAIAELHSWITKGARTDKCYKTNSELFIYWCQFRLFRIFVNNVYRCYDKNEYGLNYQYYQLSAFSSDSVQQTVPFNNMGQHGILLSGDGVSSFVLRECPDAFTAQLTILFNLSLSKGEFPSSWRAANVSLLYKKGS